MRAHFIFKGRAFYYSIPLNGSNRRDIVIRSTSQIVKLAETGSEPVLERPTFRAGKMRSFQRHSGPQIPTRSRSAERHFHLNLPRATFTSRKRDPITFIKHPRKRSNPPGLHNFAQREENARDRVAALNFTSGMGDSLFPGPAVVFVSRYRRLLRRSSVSVDRGVASRREKEEIFYRNTGGHRCTSICRARSR